MVVCTGPLGFDDNGAMMILALVMMMVMMLMATIMMVMMMMMVVMTNAKRRVSGLVVYTGPSGFEDDDHNVDVDRDDEDGGNMEKPLFYLRMTCINGLRVDLLENKKMIGLGRANQYETKGEGLI